MNEQKAREYVKKLRRFYTDALIYTVVNIGLVLIWAISGGGYFWPIWVIIGWGIGLGVHAFSLGLIPQIDAVVPFMTPEWEEEEVKRLTEAGHKSKAPAPRKSTAKAAEEKQEPIMAAVKPTVKKAKAAPKKKAPNKAAPKKKA